MPFLVNPMVVTKGLWWLLGDLAKTYKLFSQDLSNQCLKKAHIQRVEMMLNDSSSKDQHFFQVLKNRVRSCLSYFLK